MSLPAFMNPRPVLAPLVHDEGNGHAGGIMVAGFPMRKQENKNWCWAAVASGMDAVRGTRAGRSQCEIAGLYATVASEPEIRRALSSRPTCPPSLAVDTWGYLHEVLGQLKLLRHYDPISSDAAAAGTARADLAGRTPVGVRIDWRNGKGHFIALIGTDRVAGEEAFVVYDSSELWSSVGHRRVCSESELAGAYAGLGFWSHMYLVR